MKGIFDCANLQLQLCEASTEISIDLSSAFSEASKEAVRPLTTKKKFHNIWSSQPHIVVSIFLHYPYTAPIIFFSILPI